MGYTRPDGRHAEGFRKYLDAGFDEVYVSQIGQDQSGYFDFYRCEVVPRQPL